MENGLHPRTVRMRLRDPAALVVGGMHPDGIDGGEKSSNNVQMERERH